MATWMWIPKSTCFFISTRKFRFIWVLEATSKRLHFPKEIKREVVTYSFF